MKNFTFAIGLLGLTALHLTAASDRPNIVFILVDDQRNDTLGCAGHPVIKTPHVDRLAEQGVRFENAYVNTAICMASRATIFTGLTETSHGFTGGGPPAVPVQKMDMDTSFPVLLRQAGYRNGYYMGDRGFAGKWSHYEQSLRVPLIIRDPRSEKATRGRVIPHLVTNLDLPATILEFAEVDVPDKYQGASLAPYLWGETPFSWREDFYNEHHFNHKRLPKWRGVHGKRFTYARYYEQKPVQELLYDLEKDPDQLKNLAHDPEHAEILKGIRARTDEYTERYTRPEIEKLRKGKK